MNFSEFLKRIKSFFTFGSKRIAPSKDEILKAQCEKEGRQEDYEQYLAHKESTMKDIERFEGYIKKGTGDIKRWKYNLKKTQMSLEFIRPNDIDDIRERDYWRNHFYEEFKSVVPKNLDLRFHGTSIYNTEAILKSGGIFSSVDINDGYRASTDLSGEISVTSVDTLDRTIQGWFADFGAYKFGLPCGCVFALYPRTARDMELKKQDAMEAVDFRKHPEQLYGIFTSKENVETVKVWLENAGLDPSLCNDFIGFLHRLETEKQSNFRSSIITNNKNEQEGKDQFFQTNDETKKNPGDFER